MAGLEIRETLDGTAAREAARLISPSAIAELKALFEPFVEADLNVTASLPAFSEANAKFHARIVEESRNPILKRIYSNYNYVENARRLVLHKPGLLLRSLREHRAIVAALSKRDGAKAEQLARDHVRTVRESALQSLATNGGKQS